VASDPRVWIATLRRSHDRLDSLVQPLTPEQIRGQSYDRDWSIAQVLSHLGSGAEIALLMLPGALGEAEPASRDTFPAVWDVWNAKSPDEQAADALASDEQHVRTLEALTDEQLAKVSMDFFGMMQLDAVGLVRMRLGEHALHTWDVDVMADPGATVQQEAVALLIDNVPQFLAPRLGKPLAEPFSVRITTTDPARDYLLTSGESVTMTDWPGDDAASGDAAAAGDASAAGGGAAAGDVPHVYMPAEALLRLAYGRLDPEHTPSSVSGDADVLNKLRTIFPGF
jgi:uncharacterized protein (TIGR03083 family)